MVKRWRLSTLWLFTLFACCTFTKEQRFVIIITSYNNAPWCVKNLESMFFQKSPDHEGLYENYRIIIIDDASDDGNAEYIESYIHACNQQHRVTLIKNKTRKRALANIYMALQLCEPDEIAFNQDGDDWLADPDVFSLISNLYVNPDIWVTYGQFINWPTNVLGYCKPVPPEYIEKQLYRQKWWMPGQLRTFRVWLFNQVQLKDLLFEGPYFQGQFFPANSDLAIYYPMMEMAGTHFHFISKIIYIRNVETPFNDFKTNKDVQVLGSKLIREKSIYPRLNGPCQDYFDAYKNRKANIIMFSEKPELAQKLITSAQRLVLNTDTIYVLHPTSNDQIDLQYKALSSPTITIMPVAYDPSNCKDVVTTILSNSNQDYLMFAHDGLVFTHYTNCADCIFALEKAFAYGFFLSLGTDSSHSMVTAMEQPLPALNHIKDDIYAWAFHYAQSGDWRCYNNFAALYRTKSVLSQTHDLTFTNYHEFFEQWSKVSFSLEQVGLCYEQPKIGTLGWR